MSVALVNYSPSSLEHVLEETRNNVRLTCFLLKIGDAFEVGTVFLLVGCRSERDIRMFTSNPFVEIIFNLKEIDEQKRESENKSLQ